MTTDLRLLAYGTLWNPRRSLAVDGMALLKCGNKAFQKLILMQRSAYLIYKSVFDYFSDLFHSIRTKSGLGLQIVW